MRMTEGQVSGDHPIRPFFQDLVRRGMAQVNLTEEPAVGYVADLMTDFISTDQLYPVRDASGNRLEYLSDLVAEAHKAVEPDLRRDQFRHLGDLTLFMLGLFPERFRRGRQAMAREFYRIQGRTSYSTVARMVGASSDLTVFRSLAEEYDQYVGGLHQVRLYIRDPFYQYMFRQFGVS